MFALVLAAACGRSRGEPARAVEVESPAPLESAAPAPLASETSSAESDVASETPATPSYPAVVGSAVVDRGSGRSRHAGTQSACQACKGSWGPHGMSGEVGCICGTRDAGKPCKSPRDCEAECMVENPDNFRDVRCGPAGCNGPDIVGRCAAYTLSFGCNGRIAEIPVEGGFVREVHVLCLD